VRLGGFERGVLWFCFCLAQLSCAQTYGRSIPSEGPAPSENEEAHAWESQPGGGHPRRARFDCAGRYGGDLYVEKACLAHAGGCQGQAGIRYGGGNYSLPKPHAIVACL
jgi:hypothetical protein